MCYKQYHAYRASFGVIGVVRTRAVALVDNPCRYALSHYHWLQIAAQCLVKTGVMCSLFDKSVFFFSRSDTSTSISAVKRNVGVLPPVANVLRCRCAHLEQPK